MHYLFQAHGAMASLESMQTKQFSRLSATVEYESLYGGNGNGGAQGRSRTDGRTGQTDGKGEEDAPYSERRSK